MEIMISGWGRSCPPDRLLTVDDLKSLGFEARQIAAAHAEGLLHRVRRGIYIGAEHWGRLKEWDQDRLKIEAHFHASTGALTYTHLSAARLWGLAVWNCPDTIHVAQRSRRGEFSDDREVVHHNQTIPPGHSATARGLPVTSLERTVIDCARILPFEQALAIADSSLHAGARSERMQELVRHSAGSRNITRVREVLDALDGRSESAGETRLRILLTDWSMPAPVLQLQIPTAEGCFRADFAWPDIKLIIEFDGQGKYFEYRPTPEVLMQERHRESLLIEEGWSVLRVRWAHFNRPNDLRERISAAMEKASRYTEFAA
jgi:very-short-patch-repair endonuclease